MDVLSEMEGKAVIWAHWLDMILKYRSTRN
jgi:hypothetical protein